MRNLETKRYLLRIPKIEDAEEIYEKWGRDKDKMAEYKYHNVHKNIIETKTILQGAINETENGMPVWFAESKENKGIIAYIKILECSDKDKKVQVEFYFVENWRKDGSPEEVLGEIIRYLFTEKIYETIVIKFYDRTKEDTECLSNILEKLGMQREGVLRNRMINSKGQKINRIIYSCIFYCT